MNETEELMRLRAENERLEQEADWLANTLKQGCNSDIASNCVAASCRTSCPDVKAVCRHILAKDWREVARKAISGEW